MENQENTIPKVTANDYRKKQFPDKPQKVLDYYSSPIETKRRMNESPEDYKSFWFDPIVINYFDSVMNVKSTNWAMRKFLLETKNERLEKGKPVDNIEAILAEYYPEDYLINAELKPKKQFNRVYPPVVQKVADQFGGTVVHRQDWDN